MPNGRIVISSYLDLARMFDDCFYLINGSIGREVIWGVVAQQAIYEIGTINQF